MELSRRDVLRRGVYAAGALALPGALAACSGSRPGGAATSIASQQEALMKAGAVKGLSVFLAGGDFAVGLDNYVGLGLVIEATGPIVEGSAKVWLAPTAAADAEAALQGPFDAPWQGYSRAQTGGPPGINAADLRFDRAGAWTALVEVTTPQQTMVGTTAIEVKAKPANKAPGDRAIASQTPTTDNARGVDPICTRKPPCPFHAITLAAALDTGKPTVFSIGTPAFCESRTCGPNLEELISVSGTMGGRVNFIHSELYVNDQDAVAAQLLTPTFREWAFVSEPWVYLIDGTGVIRARYEGPVTASRVGRDLAALL